MCLVDERRWPSRTALAIPFLVLAFSVEASARIYTIDECIAVALENNVSLAQAGESLESSRSDVMSNWSGVLPRVSASITATDYLTVAEGADASSGSRTGSLSLSQSIVDASTFARISAAYHERDAAAHSLEATRRGVVFSTKEAYYALLKAERLEEVQEEALKLAEEQLRKAESLYELGSASRSDLLKARVQVGQAKLALISARRSTETARATLCYTLGIEIPTDIQVVDPPAEREEPENLDYGLTEAVSRRPDIRAKEEEVAAARRSLLAAKAARWPYLDLSVSYSRSEGTFGDLLSSVRDDYTRSASLTLSIPIFNGLATKAGIAGSKAALRSYELSLRDARLSAAYEIETARLRVLEQRERVAAAEQAVEQAEEDLKISQERFRLRAASMLELIDARVAYSQARADLVEAKYDYETAKAELNLALGL